MKRLFSKSIIFAAALLFSTQTFGETFTFPQADHSFGITVSPSTTVCQGTAITVYANVDVPNVKVYINFEGRRRLPFTIPASKVQNIGTMNLAFESDCNYYHSPEECGMIDFFDDEGLDHGDQCIKNTTHGSATVPITVVGPAYQAEIESRSGSFSVCEGSPIILLAKGDGYRKWSNGVEGAKGTTADSIVVIPTNENNSYWLELSDNNNCKSRAEQVITVNAPITGNIEGPTRVCNGETFSLAAPEGYSYSWENGAATSRTFTPNPLPNVGTHTYKVVVNTANGCSQEFSHAVKVVPKPYAQILGDTDIEEGESTNLEATMEGASYLWGTNSTTGLITNPTAASISVSPTVTADYWVDVTSSNGCTTRANVRVNVTPVPQLRINPDKNPICSGEQVVLKAEGADSYVWSTGQTVDEIVVTPDHTTTYTVTGATSAGVSSQKSVTIIVNQSENGVITGATNVCSGDSIELEAPNGSEWLWNDGKTTKRRWAKPADSFDYTVHLKGTNGCHYTTAAHRVIVNPSPATTIIGKTSVCQGDEVELTAPEGASWTWNTGDFERTIKVNPMEATNEYWVVTTGINGCTSRATKNITTSPRPNLIITPSLQPATICSGNSITLTASGATTYRWEANGAIVGTGTSITETPTATTTYTVYGSNGVECELTKEITVTMQQPENGTIIGKTNICSGEEVTLTAPSGSNWHWNTGATTREISVTPTATTSYWVELTGTNGCKYKTANHTVNVAPVPTGTISGRRTICRGEVIEITAPAGGTSYYWPHNNSNMQTVSVSPNSKQTYEVIVSSTDQCDYTASIEIDVVDIPNVTISPLSAIICQGETVKLTASGANNYNWTDDDPNTAAGWSGAEINVIPTKTTTYTVTGYNQDGTCSSIAEVTITVKEPENGTILGGTIMCAGDSLWLTAPSGSQWQWSTGETDRTIKIKPTVDTDYNVSLVGLNGCQYTTATHKVTVRPAPTGNIVGNLQVCLGGETTLTAPEGTSYIWSNGKTSRDITETIDRTTTYEVTVTNEHGCKTKFSAEVVAIQPPQIQVNAEKLAICKNESVKLTASGGLLYTWTSDDPTFTGSTSAEITVTPLATTTYTVIGVNGNGCEGTSSITITVNEPENGTITGASSVCSGESVTLIAPDGSNWTWSTGEHTKTLNVTPTEALHTYRVTLNGTNGCSYTTADYNVTVKPKPTGQIIGPDKVCRGSNIELTAPGTTGCTWLWTHNGATTQTITEPATVGKNYEVTVTTADGCPAKFNKQVIVNDLPIVTVSPTSATICAGGSVELSASGANGYVWTSSAADFGNRHTPKITVNPTTTTTYTVVGTNNNGCSTTVTVTVTVNTAENGTISGPASVCAGNEVTLIAPAGSNFVWSTGATTKEITVTPTETQHSYWVELNGTNGCRYRTADHNVTLNPKPVGEIGGEKSICKGGFTTLEAPIGSTYKWSTNEYTRSINVSPLSTTEYSVVVTNSSNCSETFTTQVVVNQPTIHLEASNNPICKGESVTITATGAATWNWQHGGSEYQTTVAPTSTETFVVTGTDANGCTATSEITINVIEPENGTIAGDTEVCEGGSVVLTAPAGSNYKWSNGETTPTVTVTPQTQTEIYYVTLTGENGCRYKTADHVITRNLKPTGTISGKTNVCKGENTTLTAPEGASWIWSNGETTRAITVAVNGTETYTVRVTNDKGCFADFSTQVSANLPPVIDLQANNLTVCKGEQVTITASGASSWSWNNGKNSSEITETIDAKTTFTVTGTDGNNCSSTSSITINVIEPEYGTITGATTVCKGESIVLSAPAGSEWLWSNGATTQTISVSPEITTPYSVRVKGMNGCSYTTADHTVSVKEKPNGEIQGTTTICRGKETTLTAPDGASWLWEDGSNNRDRTVSPTSTQEFRVTVTNSDGCSKEFTTTVTVNQPPTITFEVDNQTICQGESATITALGATLWSWEDGVNTNTRTVTPNTTTTYKITGTDNNGCSTADASVTIYVKEPENGKISGATEICEGGSVTLVAPAGSNYKWSSGQTTPTITVPINENSVTFFVTLTGNNGCRYTTENFVVTRHMKPTGEIAGNNSICRGSETTLTAPDGIAWQWLNSTSTERSITVSPSNTTDYSVIVTGAGGCKTTFTKKVTVNQPPTITFEVDNQTICKGESATITALGATLWSWEDGVNTNTRTVSPSTTTTYKVTGTDNNGCSAEASIVITVLERETGIITGPNEVCEGKSITLIAPAGSNYLWNTGETEQTITVSPTDSRSYKVTLDGLNGCRYETAEHSVIVNKVPANVIAGVTTICLGGTTILTAPGGVDWMWSTGERKPAIEVSPTVNTRYTVTTTYASGCQTDSEVEVIVNQPPTIKLEANNQTICRGESVTITATGAVTWSWGHGGKVGSVITETPTETATYTVTGTSEAGCTNVESITITVLQPENKKIQGPTEVCSGNQIVLTAPDGTDWYWSNNERKKEITVSPTTQTTYTVTLKGLNGCTYTTANHTVSVKPKPTGTIQGNRSICQGATTTLTAPNGTSWLWDDGYEEQTRDVTPMATTTYRVVTTNNLGCSLESSVEVEVKKLPAVTITPSKEKVCKGESVTLSATGADQYIWSDGLGTSANITVTPEATATYTVTGKALNGCENVATITIPVYTQPEITITGGETGVCAGGSTTLTAFAQGNVEYFWHETGERTATIVVSPTQSPSQYTVEVTDKNSGCSSTKSVEVLVNDKPQPLINGRANYTSYICAGSATTLTASVPGGGVYTYRWSTGETGESIIVTPTADLTIIEVFAEGSNNCVGSTKHTIRLNPLPIARIEGPTRACVNSEVRLVATGGGTYEWDNGTYGPECIVKPTTTTTYKVTVTSPEGCKTEVTHTITTMPRPDAKIKGVFLVCPNSPTTLTVEGGRSYQWYDGSKEASITVSPATETSYSVRVFNDLNQTGCDTTIYCTVKVHDVPTPEMNNVDNFTICQGNTTQLTIDAPSAHSYLWSTGSTDPYIDVAPQSTSVYSCTVTFGNGCSTRVERNVVVLPRPTLVIKGKTDICYGDQLTLTAETNDNNLYYEWSTGEKGTNLSSINVVPQSNTSYWVKVKNANGCESETATFNVRVHPVPTDARIDGPNLVCEGTSIALTAVGGQRYEWSTGETTPSINVSEAGTYWVRAFNEHDCYKQIQHDVMLATNPTVSIKATKEYICPGEAITLTAEGGTNCLWSTGSTQNPLTINPTVTTTYTVKVWNDKGCSSEAEITIFVNEFTQITADKTEICQGQSTTLTASGCEFYRWSNGETTETITVTPDETTDYWVDGTTNGCTSRKYITITVYKPFENAKIESVNSVCVGKPITLHAVAEGSELIYQWQPGGSTEASLTYTPTELEAGDMTFYCTITNKGGCNTLISKTITVNPLPQPVISSIPEGTICAKSPVQLVVNGVEEGSNIWWEETGETTSSITISNPLQTKDYSVVVRNANGCEKRATFTLNVQSLPTPTITGENAVCKGDPVRLEVTGLAPGIEYEYEWATEPYIGAEFVGQVLSLEHLEATTLFRVWVRTPEGCEGYTTKQVVVEPKPEVTIEGPSLACANSKVTLSALSETAQTYLWSTGETTPTISPKITETTEFRVKVTNQAGCESDEYRHLVEMEPTFTAEIKVKEMTDRICLNEELELQATSTSTSSVTYLWSTGETTQKIKVSPATTTTYTVTITNANGCKASAEQKITVDVVPKPSIAAPAAVCKGAQVTLTASNLSAGHPYSSYEWETTDGTTYSGKDIVIPSLEESTLITLRVTNENGCEATATHNITVREKPTVTIDGPNKVCNGNVAKLEASADMPATYKWSNNATTASIFITVTRDTVVSVVATNAHGCESERTYFTIKVDPPFTAEITAPQTTVCRGSEITLSVTSGAANPTYLWQTGQTTQSITVRPEVKTTYSVVVTNEFGCSTSAELEIKIDEIETPVIDCPAFICEGDALTLKAPEGYDYYLWDDGTTNPVRVITDQLETAIYTLTVTNNSGCTASASTTVTVAPKPTVGILGPNVGCKGQSTTLKANSPTAVRYLWNTGETTQTISPILTSDSIFTLKVWNSAGCESNVATLAIHAEEKPIAKIDGRDTICVGETIKLTAQGGSTYTWNVEGQVSNEIWVAPLVTTTYTVIVSNLYGCTQEVSHEVVVHQLPKPEIRGRTAMCVGDSVQLTAIDGTNALTTFVWNTGEIGKSIWVKPTTSKNYYVTAKNRFGCTATSAPHIVTVHQIPQPTLMGETTVCIGQSATLTASGGTSYSWSTGQNTPTIEIPAYMLSPVGNHSFYVDVRNAGGCVTRKEFTIETVSLPNPIINVKDGTSNLCAGDQVTLEVNGVSDARTFLWSNGSTEESITVKPTSTTTYSVKVVNANGCEKTTSITIFVAPRSDISIVSSANPISLDVSGICNEQEVVLTAIGGNANDTYEWAYDGRTEVGSQIFVHPTQTTVYSLKVTNLAGCETIKTHQILVEEPLRPTINGFYNSSGVETICYGESLKLKATGGVEYHWEGIELLGPEITVKPFNTTTYYLTVKNQAGCVATISHKVIVESLPIGKVDGPNQICSGEEIELTAMGGVSYRWSTNETTPNIRVKPTETTIYSVEIIGHNGCSVVKDHMVKVSQAPQGKIEGNTTICGNGEYAILTVSGGSAYKWQTGATTPTVSLRPSVTTTYWVDVFNIEGCKSRMYVEVKVGQRPMPTITCTGGRIINEVSSEICEGDYVMLTGQGAGEDGVYHWRSTDTDLDEIAQSINVSPTLTTTYYAESVTQDGCSAVASYTVNVLPMTKITITPTREKVCPGESVVLRAEGSSGYTWELPDGSQKTGAVIEVTPTRTSTYTVRTLNANGCTNRASITIEVVPLPVPTIYGNTSICLGSSTTLTATGGVSYRWSSGEITESIEISPLQDTEYKVIATNELGCETETTVQVTVLPIPEPVVTGNISVYKGESTTLTVTGGTSYVWNTGETTASIIVTPLETTTYEVTAINGAGCKTTIPVTVTVSDFKVNITGETIICMGQSTTLTTNGGEGATYIWNNGATTPSITVSPTETTTYSVAVHTAYGSTGTGNFTVTVNQLPKVELGTPSDICQGDGVISIPYVAREGSPTHFDLIFDEFGITQQFTNISRNALASGVINIAVPVGASPGTYKATFIAYNSAGCDGSRQEISVQVRRKDMIVRKWDDVLVCDNKAGNYVSYQWFKNGNPATGATLQYYSEADGFNGDYYVVAKRSDGGVDISCTLSLTARQTVVKVSPNPVERNKSLKIELPYTDVELFGAEMAIYDAAGKRLLTIDKVFADNDIAIPFVPGVYVVRVSLANGEAINEKFIVIK